MVSSIDPTHPQDGVPVSKAEARTNWAAARSEIEELQAQVAAAIVDTNATAITVDAASFGAAVTLHVLCTATAEVTVILSADVAAGKGIMVRKEGESANAVILQAGSGASLTKAASAHTSVTERYDHLVAYVTRNAGGSAAAWALL